MGDNNFKEKLVRYIDAGVPIICLNTFEENKVESIIKDVSYDKEIHEWNEMNGYIDFYTQKPIIPNCTLERMIDELKSREWLEKKIILIKDIDIYLNSPKIVSKIKGLARMINQGIDAIVIIISNALVMPKQLEKFVVVLEMKYLNDNEIKNIILKFIKENEIEVVSALLVNELICSFKGLTEFEIYNLLALSYADDGELTRKDLGLIFKQKQEIITKAGILEMITVNENLDDIGGLENLKQWIVRKAKVKSNIEKAKKYGVDTPKGVLIAGIQGCGKSLCTKVISTLFEVPLLRLDIAKYSGESEENLREAVMLAEAMSPSVLWIDELEKAFFNKTETSIRLFGEFLSWMKEKDSETFVVVTANEISKLPAELLRKGYFDEMFYIGLPNEKERESIFRIHIKKRRPQDLENIRLIELANKAKGFTGADIESVVKEAIETAFANEETNIKTKDIVEEIKNTNSLSEIMKESLEHMAKEYETRKFKNASE